MAIPAIKPYPMPGASELPINKVAWTPDPKRAVLLIHDMQQYFLDPFTAGESPVVELIENIRLLYNRCSELGIPVVYTAQPGGQTPEQRALLQDFWGPGINDGPYQKQIVSELTPANADIVLTKWRYSAFRKTNLLDNLQEKGRDQLLICGVYAHIGCLLTACDAFMLDVQPFFVADAVADFSLDNHKMALKYAAERCAVTIPTQRLLEELDQSSTKANDSATVSANGMLTERMVREQVAELLQEAPSTIGESDNLIDRGLDSVRLMSLVERWRRFGAEVAFVELAERPTLKDWWKLLSLRQQLVLPNADYFAL
ncbi:isochorismatase [Paenibacillus hemerocallicola]|uniref:isochorismatase n=1 Tax=Paenibacillus hemerocallicola TaxID=1172614 RepID=A0A5C4T0K1_9BACL|nr:isochorismatase [Paenibacillus hemerocallicola]TNJ61567.1 isochorismatase [Paenibacillus hemerocallicola]